MNRATLDLRKRTDDDAPSARSKSDEWPIQSLGQHLKAQFWQQVEMTPP
jgi:hypothetical protein